MAFIVTMDMFRDAPNFWERVADLCNTYQSTEIYIDRKNLLDCEKEFLEEQFKKRCDNCPLVELGSAADCRKIWGDNLFCPKRATWRSYDDWKRERSCIIRKLGNLNKGENNEPAK